MFDRPIPEAEYCKNCNKKDSWLDFLNKGLDNCNKAGSFIIETNQFCYNCGEDKLSAIYTKFQYESVFNNNLIDKID